MTANRLPILLAGIALLGIAAPVRSQPFSLSFSNAPLDSALLVLDDQATESLVFASRLVRDRRVRCLYEGASFSAALECVLRGTGLAAERVRRDLYVVTGGASDESPAPERRGSISGLVVDDETDEVLPGAHVYLPDLRAGMVTNAAGFFSFSSLPLGEYRARISFVGYETVEETLETVSGTAEIRLRPVPVQGAMIVVESEEHVGESITPGLLAVPVQQLEALPSFPGEQDLLQALQWMPGVRKSGEISGDLLVRGGEPDQNLYLLEGAPIYHPWHAFSLISTFQTETYKNVRLYRGAFPAEYGGRLSSVLDIQMKDGARKRARAKVGLSLVSGRFVVESPIGRKSSMMLSARRSYLDQIVGREHPVESPDGRLDTLRTGYYFYDVSTKWSYRPSSRHQVSLAYYEGTDDLDLRLPFDLSLSFDSWLRPADLFFEIDQRWGNRAASLKHSYLAGSRLFVTSTAYYSGYGARENAFIRPTSTSSVASQYDVRLDEVGVKLDVDRYSSIEHQFRVGTQVVRRFFDSGLEANVAPTPGSGDVQVQESRSDGWEAAVYAQDTWRPTPEWHIVLGVRGSYFGSGRHVHLTPSASASYQILPSLVLRASAGSHVQYMQRLRDRYSFMYDLVSSRWIPASSAISPSRSVLGSVGADLNVMDGITLQADAYVRRSYDVLVPQDEYRTKDGLDGPGIDVGALLGQYTEGDGRAYGIEIGARIERRLWDLLLSYSGGRTLVRVPTESTDRFRPTRYDIPRSFRMVAAFRPGRWSFAVAADARSGYPYSIPEARYALADPLDPEPVRYLYRPSINNGRLPPYGRIDMTVAYRFRLLNAAWEAQLHLYNALNQRNVVSRSFDPSGEFVEVTDRRGLPILPLLAFDVTL